MMKHLLCGLVAASLLFSQSAFGQESKDPDFAQYNVNVGFSPFGGSVGFAYNQSSKTSWLFVLGGLPSGLAELNLAIDGTDYTAASSASWVGFFVNHRPIDKARWFRLVAGIGVGRILNELDDGNGNRFTANYTANPVGYLGIGFGSTATKGFTYGLDIGWLQTGGPNVLQVEGAPDAKAVKAIGDDMFFGSALPNIQLNLGWGF